jgi:hypothetical protein
VQSAVTPLFSFANPNVLYMVPVAPFPRLGMRLSRLHCVVLVQNVHLYCFYNSGGRMRNSIPAQPFRNECGVSCASRRAGMKRSCYP